MIEAFPLKEQKVTRSMLQSLQLHPLIDHHWDKGKGAGQGKGRRERGGKGKGGGKGRRKRGGTDKGVARKIGDRKKEETKRKVEFVGNKARKGGEGRGEMRGEGSEEGERRKRLK